MPSRQKVRSEETRQAILAAAGQLFGERGFDAVTMREIAQAAGCSHTTIYIYFKDKEALLHQLAMGPLQSLQQHLESILADQSLSPDERLRRLSHHFLAFCLRNRNMYALLFMARATRVDEEAPALAVNQVRNNLFGLLRQAVEACLPPGQTDDLVLACARILFFALHGMISTYSASEEPLDHLLQRLGPTFDLAVDVTLAGIKETVKGRAGRA